MIDQQFVNDIVNLFFKHQLTIKMYHFQTKNYGAHKASDSYLEKFTANLDRFMEVAQGIVGVIDTAEINIQFTRCQDDTIQSCLDRFGKMLGKLNEVLPDCPDLLTIRDEMLADINQFKYLLKFE